MESSFWKDKRVLITGHNGFKGCWLSKWLDLLEADVLGISLEPEKESGYDKLTFSKHHQNRTCDIRGKELGKYVAEFRPEIVFHLAAQAIVKTAKEHPAATFSVNVMGTVNLLETLREVDSVRTIVVITSDKVYQNEGKMSAYVEGNALMGEEPYSCSKVAQEQVARAYFEACFLEKKVALATARACNCFGGGDFHFDRLIPSMERCAFYGETPQLRNPDAVRPWQYVLDILNGYLMLAQHLYLYGTDSWENYNFGPKKGQLYTVGDLAQMICKKEGMAGRPSDFREAKVLMLDSEKARKELGWKTLYTMEEGLAETGYFYSEYLNGRETDSLYTELIERYRKKQEEWNPKRED